MTEVTEHACQSWFLRRLFVSQAFGPLHLSSLCDGSLGVLPLSSACMRLRWHVPWSVYCHKTSSELVSARAILVKIDTDF